MDDFESMLKRTPLRPPSDELDHRVSTQRPSTLSALVLGSVPLWAAAAALLVTAIAAFAAGAWWQGARTPEEPPVATYLMCDGLSRQNPFDFTSASAPFAAGTIEVSIRGAEGG